MKEIYSPGRKMSYILFEKSNESLPSFEVGTKLKCLRNIEFVDGSWHFEGLIYTVKEENQAYFSVAYKYYLVVK